VSKVRRYVVTGAGDFPSVLSVLVDHVGLKVASDSSIERIWLDTDDNVLQKSGMALEFHRPIDPDLLASLTWFSEGRVLAHDSCVAAEPPSRASELPDIPAMKRLAEEIGSDLFVQWPRTTSRIVSLVALDDEEKTTTRVVLDDSALVDGTSLPLMIELLALRGYEDESDAVESAIAKKIKLQQSPLTMAARARTAGGRGRSAGRTIVAPVDPSTSAVEAWREVLRDLSDVMTTKFDGMISGEDPEDLHAFRVAVRRIRTVLQDGDNILNPIERDQFRKDFHWLGDITTPTRDADVYLAEFPNYVGYLAKSRQNDLEPFRGVLETHRSAAHAQMVTELRSITRAEFAKAWATYLADDARWVAGRDTPDAGRRATKVAAEKIQQAHRHLLRDGRAITKKSPPVALHDLRKDAKRLRYLIECFGSLFDDEVIGEVTKPLRQLQDVLGEYQDTEVQARDLLALTERIPETSAVSSTFVAIGSVVDQINRRGGKARSHFTKVFQTFDARSVNKAFGQIRARGGKNR